MTTTEPRKVFPKVLTGTHGPEEGAGAGTPWPDDVPPGQDDTWYPLRDDPWRAAAARVFHCRVCGASQDFVVSCSWSSTGRAARPNWRDGSSWWPLVAWAPVCCCGRATFSRPRGHGGQAPSHIRPGGAGRGRRMRWHGEPSR